MDPNPQSRPCAVTALPERKSALWVKGAPGGPARLHTLAHELPSLRLLQGPLWLSGDAAALQRRPAVTIVGSRAASASGLALAQAAAAAVAERGGLVISGGALGIDAAAHRGALGASGATCAVLGCGVDVAYPQRHAGLFAQIREQGCLLSSYPPGSPPIRWHFPERNELMAALADLVVVVEADLDSGSLITVAHARRHGRMVAAFAGSAGTDAALAGGAALVRTAADVLALLDRTEGTAPAAAAAAPQKPRRQRAAARTQVAARQQAAAPVPSFFAEPDAAASLGAAADTVLLSALAGSGSAVDLSELCARTGLLPADCAAALVDLELRGQCTRLAGGRYIGHAPLG